MPLPRVVARFNKHVTNPILGPIVRFLPGFGTIVHSGRKSGRQYRTPIMAFRRGDRLVFALTYGREAEWVQNVLAAGAARLESGWSGILRLTDPRLVHGLAPAAIPLPIRLALRVMRVRDFLETTIAPED